MDLGDSNPRLFRFRPNASPFEIMATSGHLFFAGFQKREYGLGGIRTRGLYVANVTIYP
jgi:hypothetical protein